MRDILNLGDISTPDLEDVTITRDGQTCVLQAYRNSPRAPGIIKGMMSAARREYNEATNWGRTEPKFNPLGEPVLDDDGQPVMVDLYEPNDTAWFRMLRKQIQIAIPGLQDNEVDVLSGNDTLCLDILRELGWWPKVSDESETADDAEGEAQRGPSSTTATRSRG